MAAVCSRWYLALCLLPNGMLLTCDAVAQYNDDPSSRLSVTLQYETVGGRVNYSPNLPDGGFAPADRRARFQSAGFVVAHESTQKNSYYLSFKQRQLNSLRDTFTIYEAGVGVSRPIQRLKSNRYSLEIGLDAHFNYASEIFKNSYTSYADTLITEVRFKEPQDARLALSLDMAMILTDHLHLQAGLSGGLSRTDVKRVTGSAILENGCGYEFNATSNGGSLQQIGSCGSLVSYEQNYPNNQTLKDRLGFSVTDDLTYRDYFLAPELSLHWQRDAWTLATGYEFRQYFRPSIDHRIRQSGGAPATRNHNAYAQAGVQIFNNWQVAAGVRYQRAAFLDDIPFLYNALTYQRYNGKGVLRYNLSLSRYF